MTAAITATKKWQGEDAPETPELLELQAKRKELVRGRPNKYVHMNRYLVHALARAPYYVAVRPSLASQKSCWGCGPGVRRHGCVSRGRRRP